MQLEFLVSNGSPLRWRIVVMGRFAVGCGWVGGVAGWSGRQSGLFVAVVAVASVVPVSPLVSMARRVST